MGPNATTDGLVAGTGQDVDGVRYVDLARYGDSRIRDVAGGIEVGLGSQPYRFQAGKNERSKRVPLRTETYPIQKATVTFDLHIFFKQVGNPDVPYGSIVEVRSIMETLEPVT